MWSSRSYLAAFAGIHAIDDAAERRRVTRQGLAMLAQIAEREPAPLEGLPAEQLLLAVRAALADDMLGALDWMSPAAGAVALFALAQALPSGPERRELGRRVLERLRDADRDTFVALTLALARSSPKLLASEALRARVEVVLSAPLTMQGAIGELALGILAQPALATSIVEVPATGALPGRRLAARILAHGAREAVRRHDAGDRGGVRVLARPATREALARLLGDREALVWRFACIARGLLAHVDSNLADDIDRELRPSASSTELRRAAASAAAALERGGAASRWEPMLVERAAHDPGVARGAILGLAGLAVAAPDAADGLATQLVERAPLDAAEGLVELRREEGSALLPRATAAAVAWTRAQLAETAPPVVIVDVPPEARAKRTGTAAAMTSTLIPRIGSTATDDGRWSLLHALDSELGAGPRADGVGIPLADARAALDRGDVAGALREARTAVEEIAAMADWLERATDDDPLDRRHSMRILRELDREVLADGTLVATLGLAPETDPMREAYARALAGIESALLAREAQPEAGPVAHGGLRIARLRALVRLLDGVRVASEGDADLASRLAVVRRLMDRAAADHSPLRRAVWAALTRAGDALVRDGHAEITDLMLAWPTVFVDDDFAILREASMVPEIEAAFEAYVRLHAATWAASDPDDTAAVRTVVERLGDLADALPPERSPRVESVRLALARLAHGVSRVTAIASHAELPPDALQVVAGELGALARRTDGARRRLGLAGGDDADRGDQLEARARALDVRLEPAQLEEAIALSIEAGRDCLPPAIGAAVERVLLWLLRRPSAGDDATARSATDEAILPAWVPLSRRLGGYHVLRPIGRGAAASVLLAVRADERTRADCQYVALKVPEYSGGVARNLSEQEFEAMFREEAGALLALPVHPNIAQFITFDARAQPKPLLAMEFVPGENLEAACNAGLDIPRALRIVDDLLAGLDAMHKVQIAHLDVKPANVVLRRGSGVAVLVDFGLAGRRLRAGCGSVHYGAAEVWADGPAVEPFPADVYAAACVAFELLTNSALVRGDSLKAVVDQHFTRQPAAAVLAQLERMPRLAPLAELLRAAVARDPKRRPTAARLRAGFAAIAPDLKQLTWPIDVA